MRKLRARSLLCLSLMCSCVLSASLASAAPPVKASADDDATVAMARERFKEGVGYFDQKQYDKARAAFLQAYALKKHPAVLLNLAQSELRSAHEADAATHFSAYLREATDSTDAEKQAAEAGLAAAKVTVTEVDVRVAERGAEIYVDGALQGNSPLPGTLYVAPGSHTVEARKDGRTASTQLNALAGKHIEAELEFAPAKPAPSAAPLAETPPPEVSPEPLTSSSGGRKPFFKWLVSSPVGITGLGLTLLGAGDGVVFALVAKNSYKNADSVASQITTAAASDIQAYAKPNNPGTAGLCSSPSAWLNKIHYPTSDPSYPKRLSDYTGACGKYQDNVHNGDTFKTVATVGFVVAGVAAVGTVVYYFVDPNAHEKSEAARAPRRSLALVPSVGPGERGLSVIGSF